MHKHNNSKPFIHFYFILWHESSWRALVLLKHWDPHPPLVCSETDWLKKNAEVASEYSRGFPMGDVPIVRVGRDLLSESVSL
jgi:hypothetical protein